LYSVDFLVPPSAGGPLRAARGSGQGRGLISPLLYRNAWFPTSVACNHWLRSY